jgi:outer membrane protein insertion porin family
MENRFLISLLLPLMLTAQTIREIRFTGNNNFSDSELSALLLSRSGEDLDAKKQRLDVRFIDNFYQKNGYFFADISSMTLAQADGIVLLFTIAEGNLVRIDSLTLRGRLPLDSTALSRDLERQAGVTFTLEKVNRLRNFIGLRLADTGFPFADITVDYQVFDSSLATIDFTIQSGPKVQVDSIRYVGLEDVASQIAERETVFRRGDIYSDTAIQETQNNLYNTGLFDYIGVRIVPVAGSDSSRVDVEYFVDEIDPAFVELSLGLAYEENVIYNLSLSPGFVIGHNNLWGVGRRISLTLLTEFAFSRKISDINATENLARLSFVEPRIFGTRFDLTNNLTYQEKRGIDRIDYNLWLLQFLLPYRFENTFIDAGFSFQQLNTLEEGKLDTSLIVQTDNREFIFSIWNIITSDVREDFANPIDGSLTSLETKYSYSIPFTDSLAHSQYITLRSFWNRYQPLFGVPGLIYASRLQAGAIFSIGANPLVPYTDRLFLGGANSIRGLAERTAGPLSFSTTSDGTLVPIGDGGKASLLINNELRYVFANWGMFSLGGEAFLDVGGLWPSLDKIAFNDWHAGTGLGALLLTPLGALRLDYGYNLRPRTLTNISLAPRSATPRTYTEPDWVFHFSINFAF